MQITIGGTVVAGGRIHNFDNSVNVTHLGGANDYDRIFPIGRFLFTRIIANIVDGSVRVDLWFSLLARSAETELQQQSFASDRVRIVLTDIPGRVTAIRELHCNIISSSEDLEALKDYLKEI